MGSEDVHSTLKVVYEVNKLSLGCIIMHHIPELLPDNILSGHVMLAGLTCCAGTGAVGVAVARIGPGAVGSAAHQQDTNSADEVHFLSIYCHPTVKTMGYGVVLHLSVRSAFSNSSHAATLLDSWH